MVLAVLTAATVAAGASAVYYVLAGQWTGVWWSLGVMVLGVAGGGVFWSR